MMSFSQQELKNDGQAWIFEEIFDSFEECHGDRLFADDEAIVGGIARLDGKPVTVIGIQKDGICRKISAEILVLPILKAIEKLYD